MNNITKEQNQNREKLYIKNLKKVYIDHWAKSELIKDVTKHLVPNQYPDQEISEEVAKRVADKLKHKS